MDPFTTNELRMIESALNSKRIAHLRNGDNDLAKVYDDLQARVVAEQERRFQATKTIEVHK